MSHFESSPTPHHAPAAAKQGSRGSSSVLQLLGVIIRSLALLLVITATIVMGAAKQKLVDVPIYGDYLGKLTDTVKMHDSPVFVYFTAANAIVVGYTLLSLVASLASRTNPVGKCTTGDAGWCHLLLRVQCGHLYVDDVVLAYMILAAINLARYKI